MNAITDIVWVEKQIQEIKHNAPQFVTNAFLTPTKMAAWLQAGGLFGVLYEKCLFLLRGDADFYHLYYFAPDSGALSRALAALPTTTQETLVCDLVGRRSDVSAIASVFSQRGFRPYVSLYRMTRSASTQQETPTADREVVAAEPADAETLLHILHTAFDRYAEQIPPAEEIQAAIAQSNILVVKRDANVAGFLHFELAGFTSTVRYWYVDPAYRNQGIASRLMREFFSRCGKAKRAVLWVKAANDNAIVRYNHLGFAAEDLVDEIMILRRSGE